MPFIDDPNNTIYPRKSHQHPQYHRAHPIDNVDRVLRRVHPAGNVHTLPKPAYNPKGANTDHVRLALAVASMKDHMTDEGWQIMLGLSKNGYRLCGHGLSYNETNVKRILDDFDPTTLILQDKREWDIPPDVRSFRDPLAAFTNVPYLSARDDVFKLTILKDAHQRPQYHADSAREIGCHAWVTYYATPIVKRLAPYVREEHLIRTYHTIDPTAIPAFSQDSGRDGCLLSGAVSSVYPLRQMLYANAPLLPNTTVHKHPGYHRNGCDTPQFLQLLSGFKVALCTASMYGYALRKMIEATACGCVVITNLPSDEQLPYIDDNLIRIPSNASVEMVAGTIRHCLGRYSHERQRHFAEIAQYRYSYQHETERLATLIEQLRLDY